MMNNKARFLGVNGTPTFCIMTDFLEGYKPTKEEMKKKDRLGLNDFFELYDDDGVKYYSGYANFELMDEFGMDEFTILDMAMYDAGCTYIKTRSKNGKMEMV
jgi:hypothetical protein